MIPCFQLIPVQKNRWETLRAAILTLLVFCATLLASSGRAQETPLSTVDEECTAIAYASDGRIALGARHVYNLRQFQVQRDDIFVEARPLSVTRSARSAGHPTARS